MPNIPCDVKINCDCSDTPFKNLSSEAPDLPGFFSVGYARVTPPLGTNWQTLDCASVCTSFTSQTEADLCAYEQAFGCVTGPWLVLGPALGPSPPARSPVGGRASPLGHFKNQPQSATVFCPDGEPFVFKVDGGKFTSYTQAAADMAALTYGQQQAEQNILCLGALGNPLVCAGTPYADSITASGKFLTPPPGVNFWSIFGNLPPGLVSDIDFSAGGGLTGNTLNFSGTPTVPGVYTFSVQVEDGHGNFQVKPFTISVPGITNGNSFAAGTLGTAYSQNVNSAAVTNPIYSLEVGLLPDGLQLNSGGIIYGTPTAVGTFKFTLGVTEAGTGRTCKQDGSIVISGLFGNLVWNNPPDLLDGNSSLSNAGANFSAAVLDNTPFNSSDADNTGHLTYTGPIKAATLTLSVTGFANDAPGLTNSNALVTVDSSVDGNLLNLSLLSSNGTLHLGVYVRNFNVPASVGAVLTVHYAAGASGNGGGNAGVVFNANLQP